MQFNGTSVVITGAGRGLGRALAVGFASEGAQVALVDLTPVNLDETERQLLDMGADCLAVTADVSKKRQVQGALAQVVERFDALDVLINNAGVWPTGPILTMDEWDWDRTIAVNLRAPFLMIQSAARLMHDQGGGNIINIGAGELRGEHLANSAAYAASKTGLVQLTRAAAIELAPSRIRVNLVAPQTSSGSPAGELSQEQTQWQAAVVDAVLYLASPRAKFVTGEVIAVQSFG